METIEIINKAFEYLREQYSMAVMTRLTTKDNFSDVAVVLKQTIIENEYFSHEYKNLWLVSDKDNVFGNIYLPLTEDVYMVFEVQNKRN